MKETKYKTPGIKHKLRNLFVIDDQTPTKNNAPKIGDTTAIQKSDKPKKEHIFIPVLINSISLGIGLKIIIALFSFLFFQIDAESWSWFVAFMQVILFGLSLGVYLYIIYRSIRDYKKNTGGYITLGKGFFLSYLSALALSFLDFISFFVMIYLFNNFNLPPDSIWLAILSMGGAFSSMTMLLGFPLFGIFICLLASAIMHKNKPVPFRSK